MKKSNKLFVCSLKHHTAKCECCCFCCWYLLLHPEREIERMRHVVPGSITPKCVALEHVHVTLQTPGETYCSGSLDTGNQRLWTLLCISKVSNTMISPTCLVQLEESWDSVWSDGLCKKYTWHNMYLNNYRNCYGHRDVSSLMTQYHSNCQQLSHLGTWVVSTSEHINMRVNYSHLACMIQHTLPKAAKHYGYSANISHWACFTPLRASIVTFDICIRVPASPIVGHFGNSIFSAHWVGPVFGSPVAAKFTQ